MKKFRFKLEKYLEVTRRKKDEAERRFADASRLLEEAKLRLTELLHEMQKGQRDYDVLIENGKRVTVGVLMTYNSFFDFKRRQIEQQQQTIMECKAQKQKRLNELLKIMSRLKSIEQLKEKRLQEYKDEILFEESKMLDEIGLQLHMRRRRKEQKA
ncbi:MAG: flagellar export protein FliJ [Schwartzia sp.]|nr:flagellar export protein FliJ [Schwartzia sp. (in: firmicutes)]